MGSSIIYTFETSFSKHAFEFFLVPPVDVILSVHPLLFE